MYQDARRWLAEARLQDEQGDAGSVSLGMTVDAWFEFWIVTPLKWRKIVIGKCILLN